jgi:hypothetical protein
MGKKGWLALLVLVLLLLPNVSQAGKRQQEALRGLKSLIVLVEEINPEAERLGLSRTQLKTDVELRLRKAGIKVLTQEESINTPGQPFLYVNITTGIISGFCTFGIEVDLNEMVIIARGVKVVGSIWDTSIIGRVGINNIKQIRNSLADEVDKFINDYLAANSK